MDKERIITMKSILKKENGEYLYKQNRTTSFNTHLEALYVAYYTFHKRNQILFEGLKKSIDETLRESIRSSLKLHIFSIHEPMDVPKEEIYQKYVIDNKLRKGEAAILMDILPGRRGEIPKNDFIYAYWSLRDIANDYSSIMSFIYHLITDMFSTVQLHADVPAFNGDMIIDFNYGTFLNKRIASSFRPELKNKYDWKAQRTILNDRFSSLDSISSDPLADAGVFKACADDFFMLFRLTIFDKYTKFLREDSINSKNRIDTIKERIQTAEFSLINDEADKELEDMNDILNTRLEEGDE